MKKIAATLAAIAAFAYETPVRALTHVGRTSSISRDERRQRTRLRKQKERQKHA